MSTDIKRLIKADNKIQKIVEEFGLDCYPQEFDVIPAQKMLEIMSYHLPVNYSHWSFGREYEKHRTQYEYTSGIPYEVVLNSNPSRAFLMNTNPYPIQVLVMAHVYAHNDFMKNNRYFVPTRKDMLTSASEAATRFRKYEEDFGVAEVETLIDSAHAIQWNINSDFFIEEQGPIDELERKNNLGYSQDSQSEFADFFDYDKKQKPVTFEEHRIKRKQQRQKLPAKPDRDLMQFIMKHSPRGFEEWELDILNFIREQSRYFSPQMKTKVMNEGWATFWHMRIMDRLFKDGFLNTEEHGYYNLYNARVVACNPVGINPYLLGVKSFQNIEDRFNKGQFGREWEENESQDKWDIDTAAGKGLEKIFEVRRTHMDWFFLEEFLNEKICDEAQLYIFQSKIEENIEEFVIEETGWRTVKNWLVRSYAHSGMPLIKVIDGDYSGKRELYLKHFYEGLSLDEEYCYETLRNIYNLWDRPVYLETVEVEGNKENHLLIKFDGKEFSTRKLSSVDIDDLDDLSHQI